MSATPSRPLGRQEIIDCFTRAGVWLGVNADEVTRNVNAVQLAIAMSTPAAPVAALASAQRHTYATIANRMIGKARDDNSTEYVTLADAEAAVRAVTCPTCPTCGTHEVELCRTCNNSSCASYATPKTTYQGWKEQPAPCYGATRAELPCPCAACAPEQAMLYRDFTKDAEGLGYDGLPDALDALRTLDAMKRAAPVLDDPAIVEVLASLGTDSEKSQHDWNPVLQVRTTVPAIRQIVAAYLTRAAEPTTITPCVKPDTGSAA